MNLVEPIRDLNKIEEMKKVLLEQGKRKRDFIRWKNERVWRKRYRCSLKKITKTLSNF